MSGASHKHASKRSEYADMGPYKATIKAAIAEFVSAQTA